MMFPSFFSPNLFTYGIYLSVLHPQGLTSTFASQILERDGPNELKPPKGIPEYVKFARQLAGGLQCLMWVAAIICFIAFGIELSQGNLTSFDDVNYISIQSVYSIISLSKQRYECNIFFWLFSLQLYLAITLIAVVVVTGCFGYYQEFKSTNIIASFKNLVPQVSCT